ncbi:MAG: hypothetical protein AUJ49_05480 [Desulfovibrionaceae bacterium CG1_02_65_16]|nr:MAG: hypothetical protein AUJ49_05480 [Desulfovibrionaceae bacterium CG1_02_65_16]
MDVCRLWLRLGCFNVGDAQRRAARLDAELAERGWLAPEDVARARAMCRLLPGSQTQLLAVCLGWRLRGVPGGLAAGVCVLLPLALALLAASCLAARFSAGPAAPVVDGALRGLAGGALAVIAVAFWRTAKSALTHPVFYGFAAVSLLMGYALHLKFYGVIIVAVLMGIWLGQVRPDIFCPGGGAAPGAAAGSSPWRRAGRLGLWFTAAWLMAGLAVRLLAGPEALAPRLLNFAVRAGFFAFGGAYGALSFISDMSLRLGWTGQDQLALGLGLAGLGSGPLLLAAQHAGFAASLAHPGGLAPMAAGALGALGMTFGLFLPGFYVALACAPRMEAVAAKPWLRAANAGVAAAMVGVILKIGLLFGAAVLWPQGLAGGGPLDTLPLVAACACLLLSLRRGAGPGLGLLASAVLGVAWALLR